VSKLKSNGVEFKTKAEIVAEGIGGHHSESELADFMSLLRIARCVSCGGKTLWISYPSHMVREDPFTTQESADSGRT
jgi:hypothetical protein